jgi:hypothetical protein
MIFLKKIKILICDVKNKIILMYFFKKKTLLKISCITISNTFSNRLTQRLNYRFVIFFTFIILLLILKINFKIKKYYFNHCLKRAPYYRMTG